MVTVFASTLYHYLPLTGLQRRLRPRKESQGRQGHPRVQLQREVHLWKVRLLLHQAQKPAQHVQEDQLVHQAVPGELRKYFIVMAKTQTSVFCC